MLRYEREGLERLTRDRERLAKAAVDGRAAEMKADFERKISAEYSFDQDPVWKEAYQRAQLELHQANQKIASECEKLGIPRQFAPGIDVRWCSRGENMVKTRREELRKSAYAEIDVLTKNAKTQIGVAASGVRVRLLEGNLTSDDAKQFLESMPSIEDLMPMLSLKAIEQKAKLQPILQAANDDDQ